MSISTPSRGFASDNNATIHARIMDALADANRGHAFGYGGDPWTEHALKQVRQVLGPRAHPYFVFNGTGANVVGLSTLLRPFHAVICASGAHVNVDECGAPERFGGFKLIVAEDTHGKLTPQSVEAAITGVRFEHHVQVRAVSISQCTELGTVYTPAETRALADTAHAHGLLLHVDGARLSNAAARLGVGLRQLTLDAGVDVLSLGGTKNGMMLGECVVFTGDTPPPDVPYVRKQAMQLFSKMRFVSAQFSAWLKDDLWLQLATHANAMATRLANGVKDIQGVRLVAPVEANAVFAEVPRAWIPVLQQKFTFYTWDEKLPSVRWMCSHDTTAEDVDALVAAVAACAARN